MNNRLRCAVKTLVLTGVILAAYCTRAEEFTIQIGSTVSDGVPGVGAGQIENVAPTDVMTIGLLTTNTAGRSIPRGGQPVSHRKLGNRRIGLP